MTTTHNHHMTASATTAAWMVDYFHALLAMHEEVEGDRPEGNEVDAEHALKLAQARTELMQRQLGAVRQAPDALDRD